MPRDQTWHHIFSAGPAPEAKSSPKSGAQVREAASHCPTSARLVQQPAVDEVACEASGGYERPMVAALLEAGFRVRVLEAGRVRQFARAGGRRAKTDRSTPG